MQESSSQSPPFKVLGTKLKFLREDRQESVAEVSGAVEIDPELLERMEKGEERPSEDILMLLINHFGMPDHEAVHLWESAGYVGATDGRSRNLSDPHAKTIVLLAVDARVLYSDAVIVAANQAGLVLNFMQTANHPQSLPIARVGMSYEQAEEVVRTLQRTLLRHKYMSDQQQLPPGDTAAQ